MFQHILVPPDGIFLCERAAQVKPDQARGPGAHGAGFVAPPLPVLH